MIPKVIHYCWFGHGNKAELAKKCIQSWREICPNYQIVEWNEDNYDISAAPRYVQEAYAAKKWAFVTDYVRLQIIYENGGIYMDTDVELKKPLDDLLHYDAYFGFECGTGIATGLGFGAIKGHSFLKELMSDYENIPFIRQDGSYNLTTCGDYNRKHFAEKGLVANDKRQVLPGNILILPSICLCPINILEGKRYKSKETYSIHWYSASWKSEAEQEERKNRYSRARWNYFLHTPHRALLSILGEDNYGRIRDFTKCFIRRISDILKVR